MKFQIFKVLTTLLFTTIFMTFFGCDNKSPNSPAAGTVNTYNLDEPENVAVNNTNALELLKSGPVSNEKAAAVKAPEKKITRREGELNIIKVESRESLQKRFISSWYVTPFSEGWVYLGNGIHGKTWLYFPAFTVSQPVVVTIDWESTGLLTGGVTFSPHGIQFNSPVTVWISFKDVDLGSIDPSTLKIWYWNDVTNLWELIGDTVDLNAQMVGGLLNHFSRYALGTE